MHAILEFLTNDATLTVIGLLFGFMVKDHPAWAKVPNMVIPYLNALIALALKLAAAGAGAGGPHAAVYACGVTFASAGTWAFLNVALAAGWQSIVTSLVYEFFVRNPKAAMFPPPAQNQPIPIRP